MNKKLILAFSIFTASLAVNINSATAQEADSQNIAQQDLTPEQRTTKQVQRMTKALSLTNEQVAQIQPIVLQLHQKRDALRNAQDKRAAMKEMWSLVAAQDEKMKTILNADQLTKYEDIKEEMREKTRGKKGRRG